MQKKYRGKAALIALAACIAIGGIGAATAAPEGKSPYQKLSLFARVLSHLERLYVEPVDGDRLIEGAIRGMVRTLDPHSAFLTPDEYDLLEEDTKGRFGGVGIEVGIRNDRLTVIAPIAGSPAERAGIRPGDEITAVGGQPTEPMSLLEVVSLMRGEPGTEVSITIQRPGAEKPFDVKLVREAIRVESVRASLLSPGLVWVQVKLFQEGTAAEVSEAIARIARGEGGLRGVLLDLRQNPGGLLEESVRLSDLFIARGVLVTTRGRNGQVIKEWKASGRAAVPDAPMVALIDGGSASAAEIVAGALQDHGRALLVGSRSFGKGSVQSIIDLGEGYGLKLTVARYFTPKGRSIQADGVAPDVAIDSRKPPAPDGPSEAEGQRPGEAALPGHLAPERPSGAAPAAPEIEDYQLRIALQLLAGLARADRRSGGNQAPYHQ